MKETTPPKDPKKKLWIGYAVIIAILFACNLFLFPAMMQAKVKSVNYSTFLQMLENKQLSTVQIEDQQIYFVDNENNSYKTNAIAQDNNLVTRLEDAGVEFGTVYQSPTIWDSLLNLAISLLPMILLFWWLNRYIGKKMQSMGGDASLACSEQTASRVDAKVVEIVQEQHKKAYKLLADNRRKLDEIAQYLYEKETISGEEFMRILNAQPQLPAATPADSTNNSL